MYLQLATEFMLPDLLGRYITNSHIEPVLEALKNNNNNNISIEGKSVLEKNIYSIKIGTGKTKILLWSQMHGNESTTTKGLFDFINFLQSDDVNASEIKENYTLLCIPILNPDGATLYTRENANNIDLNRDAFSVTQPESLLLRKLYLQFKPDFCYNLHDQRTIFGTENSKLPASMSFLSPSYSNECEFNDVRLKAVEIINKIHNALNVYIPNQIGRFDDAFNINCVGDYFTNQGTPTILFEAGHYKQDYQREEVRKFVFISLVSSLLKAGSQNDINKNLDYYLNIPQNSKYFFDFIYRNVTVSSHKDNKIINFAAQFREELVDNKINFVAEIIQIDTLNDFIGHLDYDCKRMVFDSKYGNLPIINKKADFKLNNMLKCSNGLLNL
jgi:hypothetical protein